MAYFITRVELHGATTYAPYQGLHTAMESRGFARTIMVNGSKRHLPMAEYYHADNVQTQAIMDKTKAAVATTGYTAAILVSHVSDGVVDGLAAA